MAEQMSRKCDFFLIFSGFLARFVVRIGEVQYLFILKMGIYLFSGKI